MAWFKVDDGLHASRKLLKIPKRARFAAIGLWTVAGSWSADQLTNGTIPEYMLTEWGAPPTAPDALVDADLWERTSDGYVFRNWLEYQPSKQDVDAEREASRHRMRDLRARRKQKKPLEQAESGEVFGRTVTDRSEIVRNPDPTRPDPTINKEADASLGVQAERRQRTKVPTPIPDDFAMTATMQAWAMRTVGSKHHIDLAIETEKFAAHSREKNTTSSSWPDTWRKWILKAAEFAERDRATAPPGAYGTIEDLKKLYNVPAPMEIQ